MTNEDYTYRLENILGDILEFFDIDEEGDYFLDPEYKGNLNQVLTEADKLLSVYLEDEE